MMKNLKDFFVFFVLMLSLVLMNLPAVWGQSGSGDEVERLIKDLKNESWQIRWDAAAALGETKDPRAIDPLAAALKDENSYVRMTAARALGQINDRRGIEPLITALREDDSHGVKKNAALGLKMITGQDFGKDPDAWQRWWEKNK